MHRLFSIQFQSSQEQSKQQDILKIKTNTGQICPKRAETTRSGPDLPLLAREKEFERLTGGVQPSAAAEHRIGIGRCRPSD
jgi:hypothetical protein